MVFLKRLEFGKRTLTQSTGRAFHFCTLSGKLAGCQEGLAEKSGQLTAV
jgi:hypothetical protein